TIESEELESGFAHPRPSPALVGPPRGRPASAFNPRPQQQLTGPERDAPPGGGRWAPQPAG
ncbi:MAG: hypothetical protein ACKOWF_10020, partial [Chloroflexota bacterium]